MNDFELIIKSKNDEVIVLIDQEDAETICQYTWWIDSKGYAYRQTTTNKIVKSIRMHREILNIKDPKIHVDHVNRNKLDNRKLNLRSCTQIQNNRNSSLRKNSKSGYKGVRGNGREGVSFRWMVAIGIGNKKYKNLGSFLNKHDAAQAYNAEALKLYGQFANINIIRDGK